MGPLFTSPSEWRDARDERSYVRHALGFVLRASLLALIILIGPVGATDAYWRSVPVLMSFPLSLGAGLTFATWLFHREWRAAAREYGQG